MSQNTDNTIRTLTDEQLSVLLNKVAEESAERSSEKRKAKVAKVKDRVVVNTVDKPVVVARTLKERRRQNKVQKEEDRNRRLQESAARKAARKAAEEAEAAKKAVEAEAKKVEVVSTTAAGSTDVNARRFNLRPKKEQGTDEHPIG